MLGICHKFDVLRQEGGWVFINKLKEADSRGIIFNISEAGAVESNFIVGEDIGDFMGVLVHFEDTSEDLAAVDVLEKESWYLQVGELKVAKNSVVIFGETVSF